MSNLAFIAILAAVTACTTNPTRQDAIDVATLLEDPKQYDGALLELCGCVEAMEASFPNIARIGVCGRVDSPATGASSHILDIVGNPEVIAELRHADYACVHGRFNAHDPGVVLLGYAMSTVGIIDLDGVVRVEPITKE